MDASVHRDLERVVGDRAALAQLAERLLLRARDYGSVGHARIDFPGQDSDYGHDVGGLEGFARTFLLTAFLVAGDGGHDPHGFLDWYATGLVSGTAPGSPERWTSLHDHGQPKVEAASLALALHLTRPWLWDRLPEEARADVRSYLEEWIGNDYPPCNWVWFRIVTEQFLLDAGSTRQDEIERDLEVDLAYVESLYRGGGWYSDGDGRHYDYYAGWAMQVNPTLWLQMAGDSPHANRWREVFRERLAAYLGDYVHLFGDDGAPVFQGRSLTYRFATAAPLWAGILADVGDAGQLRAAALRNITHFLQHGMLDDDDILTLGWFGPWRPLAQHYSGPGSPYWATKGLLGLLLPADHPAWSAPAVPLPVQRADTVRAIAAPGWIVAGTVEDGIVRLLNLGTDHASPGADHLDEPLYARLAYSTVTAPALATPVPGDVADNAVVLYDEQGRPSHRTGFDAHLTETTGGVGVGAWRGRVHWPESTIRAEMIFVSVVRAGVEVRFARTESSHRMGFVGWPLSADLAPEETIGARRASVTTRRYRSTITATGDVVPVPAIRRLADATPLGAHTAVPRLDLPADPRRWRAVVARLAGADTDDEEVAVNLEDGSAHIVWPDGTSSDIDLKDLAARLGTHPVSRKEEHA